MQRSDIPGPSQTVNIDDQLRSLGVPFTDIPFLDASSSFQDEVDLNKAIYHHDVTPPFQDPRVSYIRADTPRPGPSRIFTEQTTPTYTLSPRGLSQSTMSFDTPSQQDQTVIHRTTPLSASTQIPRQLTPKDLGQSIISYDQTMVRPPSPLSERSTQPVRRSAVESPPLRILPDEIPHFPSIISYDDTMIHQPTQWSARPLSPILPPSDAGPYLGQYIDKSLLDEGIARDQYQTAFSVEGATKEDFEKLWQTGSINELRQFVKNNYSTVAWLRHVKNRLKTMVSVFAREDQKNFIKNRDFNLDDMMNVIWELLAICKKKLQLMDTSYEFPKGAALDLSLEIEKSRQKMTGVIEDLTRVVENQKQEMISLKKKAERANYLRAELESAKKQLAEVRDRDKFHVQDPLSMQEFAYDLQFKLATQEYLSSSLREELEQERKTREELQEMFMKAEKQRFADYDDRTKKYKEHMRHMEMHEVIKDAIVSKIDDLKPHPKKAKKAVEDWMKTIKKTIEEREYVVGMLTGQLRDIEKRLEDLTIVMDKRLEECNNIVGRLHNVNNLINRHSNELIIKEGELRNLSGQGIVPENLLPQDMETSLSPGVRDRSLRESEMLRVSSFSPEHQDQLSDSLVIEQTPPKTSLLQSPSPPRYKSFLETMPPSPEFGASPSVTPLPVTPYISRSRFGFTDPSVPFRDLNIPPGPFQAPTPFQQTIVLTSPKREEPLLVNIAVDPKPLKDTAMGERFVCDISLDVQPGHSTLPQGGPIRSPVRSTASVIKGRRIGRYNVPPDVTPTTIRRHGLFTPSGIFKKRQFNIRRIPGEHSIELPWSPIYLPEEGRSPASPLPPFPCPGMSWERSKESYQGSPQSPSPVIKRPFYGYQLSDSDSSSPSPIIKGTKYRYQLSDSDRSSPSTITKGPGYRYLSPEWEYTPSPVIKKSSYRHRSPDWDSPVIKRTSPVTQYQSFDSYHSSPSPATQEPSVSRYVSPNWEFNLRSPVIKRSSYRYPSPDWEFNLRSPGIDRRSYQYQSPNSVRSFQSPNRTYGSDSLEYEGSVHDSSHLGEGRFLD